MKTLPMLSVTRCLVQIGLVLGTSVACGRGAESNLFKKFPVQAGGALMVDADFGSIDISTGAGDSVEITVKRSVPRASAAEAADIFAAHPVIFESSGNRVEVRAKSPIGLSRFVSRQNNNLQVHYLISVPARFNLDLHTSAGSIACPDMEGEIKLKSSGGDLAVGKTKGVVEATTSAGSISVKGATGTATLKTSGGNISVGDAGADVSAITSAGTIKVTRAAAKLGAKSRGGDIKVGDCGGPAVLETSAGSIHVKSAAATVRAKTSGGNITIGKAASTVVAHSSAGSVSAGFSAQPDEDCELSTSGGDVTARLAEGLDFALDAHTSGGEVKSDFQVAGSSDPKKVRHDLKGKIGKGGKALVLKTSAGSIALHRID